MSIGAASILVHGDEGETTPCEGGATDKVRFSRPELAVPEKNGLRTSQHVGNLHCVDRWCCIMDVWRWPGFWHPSLLPYLPRLLPSHQSGDGDDSPMVIVGFLPRTYLKHRMTRFELSSSCGLLIVLRPPLPRHRKAEERGMAAMDEEN